MYHVLQLLFSLSKIVFYPFCFHGKTNFLSLSFCIPVRVLFLYSVFNEHSCGFFRLRGVRLDLSSRTVARQVLSALCSLTSVFGMGTGGPCTLKRRTILFLRSFPHLRLRFPPLLYFVCLVGSSGLEPPTSRLSVARSNYLSYEPIFGGDKEARTPDPLLAKQVLSQLSYTPGVLLPPKLLPGH